MAPSQKHSRCFASGVIRGPACAQRLVVDFVLWASSYGDSSSRDPDPVDRDLCDPALLLEDQYDSRLALCALPGLGLLCDDTELRDLAPQQLSKLVYFSGGTIVSCNVVLGQVALFSEQDS